MSTEAGQIYGHYRLLVRIGHAVWMVEDIHLSRPVVIKIFPKERVSRRTIDVARRLAGLVHPHVVRVYEIGELEGSFFIAMEYVVGRPLDVVLREDRPGIEVVSWYAEQILRALDAIHGAGLVHRDLKPANIMISDDGTATVLGCALTDVWTGWNLTSPGVPAYSSPEQLRNDGVSDPRSDLFSLAWISTARSCPDATAS